MQLSNYRNACKIERRRATPRRNSRNDSARQAPQLDRRRSALDLGRRRLASHLDLLYSPSSTPIHVGSPVDQVGHTEDNLSTQQLDL